MDRLERLGHDVWRLHQPRNAVSLLSTRGMFAGGLREAQQKEIPIHGVTYKAMKKILDYIYTSEIELDLECVQEVLVAATLVQVSSCSPASSGLLCVFQLMFVPLYFTA